MPGHSCPNNKLYYPIPVQSFKLRLKSGSPQEVGIEPGGPGPVLVNPGDYILGKGKDPFSYMILSASESEKTIILKNGNELLNRLVAYKAYFKVEPDAAHHGAHP